MADFQPVYPNYKGKGMLLLPILSSFPETKEEAIRAWEREVGFGGQLPKPHNFIDIERTTYCLYTVINTGFLRPYSIKHIPREVYNRLKFDNETP